MYTSSRPKPEARRVTEKDHAHTHTHTHTHKRHKQREKQTETLRSQEKHKDTLLIFWGNSQGHNKKKMRKKDVSRFEMTTNAYWVNEQSETFTSKSRF